MALSFEEYLRTHREMIRPRVLVKQLKQYQEQHAENHALLGDRLLYVYLYKMAKILDKGSDVTGGATHLQSEIFSNRSLASFGDHIFEVACLNAMNGTNSRIRSVAPSSRLSSAPVSAWRDCSFQNSSTWLSGVS